MKRHITLCILIISASFTGQAQWWDYSNPLAIPGSVNGLETEESMPVFSKDSSTLYFVRTFDEKNEGGAHDQDLWKSTRQSDGTYSELSRVISLNNTFNNGSVGLNKDGTHMYLLNAYEGKKDLKKGIAVSENKNGNWGTPTPLEIPELDIEGNFYGFHMNEQEDVLIISYEGPVSLGQEDLYVCNKSEGVWSAPQHMGAVLNTPGFEISPFLNATQDTLFFSSNGLGGQGDADIFYSVKKGSWTNWSKPQNLGNRINSPKFDAYFSCSGKHAYWSSNRDGNLSDIYMIEIYTPPILSVTCAGIDMSAFGVKDGSIDAILKGGVAPFIYSWSNGITTEDIKELEKGEYQLTVTDAIGQSASTSCSVSEPPPAKDVAIRLPEVRYPLNKWSLLSDETINSQDSLLFVYNLLVEFPNLVLELSSHTDSRGSSKMNQKLSENRARACYKYLVEEKGIDPRRITPVGKGENQPKTVYQQGDEFFVSKPENMSGVIEVQLTEALINKYKRRNPKLFKQLHQFNRRTEGRVLSLEFDSKTTSSADPKLLEYIKYP